MTRHSRILAAVLLVATLLIEFGGYYLMEVLRDDEQVTEFQLTFARAGHAHAGVLAILGLAGLALADAARLSGAASFAAGVVTLVYGLVAAPQLTAGPVEAKRAGGGAG
jgi:ribulose 1,5-bisphosphate carboxylase large subunit-like protein